MIYIVKDIILKLVEYAELNQTVPVSFSSLNFKKHKPILDNLQQHDMIQRGKRLLENEQRPLSTDIGGLAFCNDILEPYERVFSAQKRCE